ncbi:hypothetical protein WN48_05936 [Eufriesea mexicana]|nr:hypothetical protein WN48_05936 [Eufriesea mexicana]
MDNADRDRFVDDRCVASQLKWQRKQRGPFHLPAVASGVPRGTVAFSLTLLVDDVRILLLVNSSGKQADNTEARERQGQRSCSEILSYSLLWQLPGLTNRKAERKLGKVRC